jgi:hypothetical protein
MYQQLCGYKVEEKLYLGVREQNRLNTTGLSHGTASLDTSQKTVFGFILYVLHANKHKMFWLQYQVTPAKSEVCTDTVPVYISLARAMKEWDAFQQESSVGGGRVK